MGRIRISYHGFNQGLPYLVCKKSPRCLLPSFMSIGLLFQEKKQKLYFQDGGLCGYVRIRIGTILVILALQDTPIIPT